MNNDHEVVSAPIQVDEWVELGEVSTETKGGLGHDVFDGGGGYYV